MYRRPAPAPALTPAARALRTEIICRWTTLFTHSAAYRALYQRLPRVDPYGDAAHLIQTLRDESDGPAHEGHLLAAVVDSLPHYVLQELGVTADELWAALKAAAPARPVYEW